MFIDRLKVSGLLSFGPDGIDLPLKQLNVLIGPNGSGKSNLLEVLALLRASPTSLPQPVKALGGVREWLWKGEQEARSARIDVVLSYPQGAMPLRHFLLITQHAERFDVVDERVENAEARPGQTEPYFFYRFQDGHPTLYDASLQRVSLQRESVKPEESILSQIRDPERYPALFWLQTQYAKIRLYRNWSFGPGAEWRREQRADGRSDALSEGGDNLALVLSGILARVKPDLIAAFQELYDGIVDLQTPLEGGDVRVFVEEAGGRLIPGSRLSDGTLRYLSLLAVLLHPEPPPLVAIEEPELGLHPDVLPHVAQLLLRASERMQLVVTTHSRMLVDGLSQDPSTVVVCANRGGESHMERLDEPGLRAWLDEYTLGDLWSKGELGGNRW